MSFDEHTSSDYQDSLRKYQRETIEAELIARTGIQRNLLDRESSEAVSQQEMRSLENRITQLETDLADMRYLVKTAIEKLMDANNAHHTLLTELDELC